LRQRPALKGEGAAIEQRFPGGNFMPWVITGPTVDGTDLDDIIAPFLYTDAEGDMATLTPDVIFALAGNDFVFAAGGDDLVYGGTGNDLILGGNGDDKLVGEAGDDTLIGGGGDDWLVGGHGNDTIRGGSGEDTIYGDKGNNALYGGAGQDWISTGDHASLADGGDGDDFLRVRMKKGADHVLTGGDGADTFEFIQADAAKVSNCVVTDFELGTDRFMIEALSDVDFMALGGYTLSDLGADTLLTLASGDTITFQGVDAAAFEAHYTLAVA
jgi:Ca2+-binding RTX toxin-like protein